MVLSQKCVICYGKSAKSPSQNSGTNTEIGQISVYFVVRKILKVPKSVCETFLTDLGNPSDWGLSYCSKCATAVNEIISIVEQLDHLKNKLNKLTEQLQGEVSQSFKTVEDKRNLQWHVIDEMRRQYYKWTESSHKKKSTSENRQVEPFLASKLEPRSRKINAIESKIVEDSDVEFPETADTDENSVKSPGSPGWSDVEYDDSDDDDDYSPVVSKRPRGNIKRSRRKGSNRISSNGHQPIPDDVIMKVEIEDAAVVKLSDDTMFLTDEKEAEQQLKLLQESYEVNSINCVNEGEVIYECSDTVCKSRFKSPFLRDVHQKRVHERLKNPYKCVVCKIGFDRKGDLEIHLKGHLPGSNIYLCPKCPFKFTSELKRNAHVQRLHFGDTHPYSCKKCGKKFERPVLLEMHLKARHKIRLNKSISSTDLIQRSRARGARSRKSVGEKAIRFKCTEDKCSSTFDLEIKRDAHVQKFHHGIKNPYQCSACPKKFSHHVLLFQHAKTHEVKETGPDGNNSNSSSDESERKSFRCEECGKECKNKSSLTSHILFHWNADTPSSFMCELCSKTFKTKRTLEEHQTREHHQELNLVPFSCKDCSKNFVNVHKLSLHVDIVHKKKFAFKCKWCPRGFPYEKQLQTHMRLHTHERPFKCPHCPKAFPQKSYLTAHIRIHTGEKPWTCSTCQKMFSDKSTYNRHVESHQGKVYRCTNCDKEYPTRHSFVVHMKTHSKRRDPSNIEPVSPFPQPPPVDSTVASVQIPTSAIPAFDNNITHSGDTFAS